MEIKSKSFIQRLISEGEHEHQDFKYQITDAKKIARSISAFANNSGGHLLVGVKDNGKVVGIESDEEIYMIDQAATMYCKPAHQVNCKIYRVEGKNVLKVDVPEAENKPIKAPNEKGEWKTYYRVADENILAGAMHVKVMSKTARDVRAEESTLAYSDTQKSLLEYLQSHGGITIEGFERLAHISRFEAERVVVELCDMSITTVTYHDGECLIVLAD